MLDSTAAEAKEMLDISAGTGKTSGTSGRFFRASRWGRYAKLTFSRKVWDVFGAILDVYNFPRIAAAGRLPWSFGKTNICHFPLFSRTAKNPPFRRIQLPTARFYSIVGMASRRSGPLRGERGRSAPDEDSSDLRG